MMKIGKIYIAAPGNFTSGGPELLHQLCAELVSNGYNAFMYYYIYKDKSDPVHPELKLYEVPYVFEIQEEENNLLIIPEIITQLVFKHKKIRKAIWWLSVDFYYAAIEDLKKRLGIKWYLLNLLGIRRVYKFQKSLRNKLFHMVQSKYAYDFVKSKNESNVFYLSDYLNDTYLSSEPECYREQKKNQIAYNPTKGVKFTQALISAHPDLEWIPIKNMVRSEVVQLLRDTKVYIDFGNHPGKDRIPREAALSGCILVTGRDGSAANTDDVSISDELKIEAIPDNIQRIGDKIKDIFSNYNTYFDSLEDYRQKIFHEKKVFKEEVKSALKIFENSL